MRATLAAVCACAILAIAAADAHALTYSDGVTLDSSYYASVQGLADSANGTSETDNKRATLGNSGGTVSLVFVTYDFPTFSVDSGTHSAYFIIDSDIKGTVSARVTAVNGNTSYSGSAVTLSGTSNSDTVFGMNYSVTTAVDITSISFLILLADANQTAQLVIDAVALPEPGTWLLFGLGAVGLGAWGHRRRRHPRCQP